jgi:iron(III) transport system permease protein
MNGAGALRLSIHYVPLGVLAALLGVLILMPIGIIVYASFLDSPPRPGAVVGEMTLDHYRNLLNPGNLAALKNSLIIGFGGTAGALTIGFTLAWLSARTNAPGKVLVRVAGVAPMFMSSLVTALAWSILASPSSGQLNVILKSLGIPFIINIYTLGGIIFVMAISYAPYVYLLINSALSLMNPDFEDAAGVHGASRWQTIRFVTIPMVTPAVIGASILVFVLVIENFPVPAILGSGGERIQTIPAFLFRLMNVVPSRANEAAAVGIALTIITVILVWMQRVYLARRSYTTVTGKGLRPRLIDLGMWRWPAAAFVALYLLIAVVLPFLALSQTALSTRRFVRTSGDLFNFATYDFSRLVTLAADNRFQDALINSLLTAVGCALIGGVLHFTMAYYVHRTRAPGRGIIEQIAMLPLSIPALVLGLGFLWTWFLLPIPLYGTIFILILATTVRFMPQGFRSISSTIVQVHPDLEDSAYMAGASRLRSIWTITVPLIRTGLVSTALLLGILAMRELSSVIFLFTHDTMMLAMVIFDYWETGSVARAAGVSLLYSILLLAITIVVGRWFKLRE